MVDLARVAILLACSLRCHADMHLLSRAVDYLSPAKIALLKDRLAANSSDSWVSGARIEALIEYDYPALSVFAEGYTDVWETGKPVPTETNSIVAGWQAQIGNSSQFIDSPGNSPTDAMSVGVGFILAAETDSSKTKRTAYLKSVKKATKYIWTIRRNSKGAISSRPANEPVQLWADEIYMLPPYMAYEGVWSGNASMIEAAYNQVRLYRNALLASGKHAWKHVVQGSWSDTQLWGTGNAWAAAGCTRVAATILNSEYAEKYTQEANQLLSWADEIVGTALSQFNASSSTQLLPNVYYQNGSVSDASSSALLVATNYRLASLGLSSAVSRVSVANIVRRQIYKLITRAGWISQTIDPLKWYSTGHSPEAVAFTLLMEAAWRDYQQTNNSTVKRELPHDVFLLDYESPFFP